jgi:hypothetical protein
MVPSYSMVNPGAVAEYDQPKNTVYLNEEEFLRLNESERAAAIRHADQMPIRR